MSSEHGKREGGKNNKKYIIPMVHFASIKIALHHDKSLKGAKRMHRKGIHLSVAMDQGGWKHRSGTRSLL